MNKVNRCIIFFLRKLEDLNEFSVAPDTYTDVEIDETLLPVLRKISIPTKIKTVSFLMGKYATLLSIESGGKLMVLPLKVLAKESISLNEKSKNFDTFETLKTLANNNRETPAIIYLPD